MSAPDTPQQLARPLAQRVRDLLEPDAVPEGGPIPKGVIDAAFEALDAGRTHYTDRPGILPLREAVCDRLKSRFNLALTPDAVTITCGAVEARYVALKQLARPGMQIALANEDAPRIEQTARLLGVEVTTSAESDSAVSCIYLSPASDTHQAAALLHLAAKHALPIIFDTSAAVTGDSLPHPAKTESLAAQVVTIGEFDPVMAGWRVGFMAGSQMAGKLRAYKQSMTICTPSVSQWAAVGLEEPGSAS
jgi:aspartate/methionine/tyrosine aminotransferase